MKIMVCGSIGFSGIEKIRRLYKVLKEKGFNTISHLSEKDSDYSNIEDFRDKSELSRKVIEYDLNYIKKADVLVILVNGPSYGTAMEMIIARNNGKKIILLAKDPVPTPWPIHFSDFIAREEEELFQLLNKIEQQGE
jgi:nucleoside 2-deoxyribosyltransferase